VAKVMFVNSAYGRVKVIHSSKLGKRFYPKKTNVKSWVLSDSLNLSIHSMVKVNGEYHFKTQKDLFNAFKIYENKLMESR